LQPTRSTFIFEEQRAKDVFAAALSTEESVAAAVFDTELTDNPAVYITFMIA
jgi:hypothetical protein